MCWPSVDKRPYSPSPNSCGGISITTMLTHLRPFRDIIEIVKVGDGAFGEVFRARTHIHDSVIMKVVFLLCMPIVYSSQSLSLLQVFPFDLDETQTTRPSVKKASAILPETIIMKEMNSLHESGGDYASPNFVRVYGSLVVSGRWHGGAD